MSLKNPVTPPGMDPGTVRLVAQRLNHYATPGFNKKIHNKIKAHLFAVCTLYKSCQISRNSVPYTLKNSIQKLRAD